MSTTEDILKIDKRVSLYDSQEVHSIIRKMSYELAGKHWDHDALAIFGILRRGSPIADLIDEQLRLILGTTDNILRFNVTVKRYDDDLKLLYAQPLLTIDPFKSNINLNGYHVIVVDDVLYTGNTILKVIEYLQSKSPKSISVACLVNRLVRKLPICPDVVGINLQVSERDIIECHIPPFESELKIELRNLALNQFK